MVKVAGYYINQYRIPLIGGTIYNVGQVYDILVTPCGVDTYISVLAFFNYLPRLAWSIYKPTPLDSFTEMLSRRKKRRKRRRFTYTDFIDPVEVGKKGSVRWVTWKIFAASERIGWYFIVIDSTVDFLVNWSSMAYAFTGCPVGGAPHAQASNTIIRNYFANGSWFPVTMNLFGPGEIWSTSAGSLQAFTTGPKMVAGYVSAKPGFRNPKATMLEARLEKWQGGVMVGSITEKADDEDPNNSHLTFVERIYNTADQPAHFNMSVRQSTGWAAYEGAMITGNGTLDDGFTWDP